MQAPPVVEDLNVLEDAPHGLVAGVVVLAVDQLSLKRVKEAFCNRVVPAVAFAAHAAHGLDSFEQALVVVTSILAAPVRVVNKPRTWFAAL